MTCTLPSLSEQIADGIVEMITREGMGVGDPLPSARALAQVFQVTPPTIREAQRRLEATGVVVLRHGSGTFVGPGFRRGLVANPHVPATTGSILDLVEARLVLEPTIAAAAARNRTDEDLAHLVTAAENAKSVGSTPDVTRHFHAVLARATGNPVLADTIEAMLVFNDRQRRVLRQDFVVPASDHAEHVGIVAAITERDAESARFLAEAHLRSLRDAVVLQLRG